MVYVIVRGSKAGSDIENSPCFHKLYQIRSRHFDGLSAELANRVRKPGAFCRHEGVSQDAGTKGIQKTTTPGTKQKNISSGEKCGMPQ